jgi:hypothetical protein
MMPCKREKHRTEKRAQLQRLPRECGGPVNDKLLAEVIYLLRTVRGSIVNWTPAFARESLEAGAFLKSKNLSYANL